MTICASSIPDQVLNVDWDKDARVVHIKLADKLTGPVTVAVKGRYTKPVVGPVGQRAALPLPVSLDGSRDAGGRIDVTVPEEVELQPTDAEPAVREAHQLGWTFDKTPQEVVVSWQPYKPDTHASSVIDVTLHGPAAEVREELRLQFPRAVPDQITLRAPAVVGDSLQLLDGGQFLADPAGSPTARAVRLLGSGQERVLRLRYSFPTTEKSFPVPLVAADQAPDGETRVRVWSDSGQLPLPPEGEDGWGVQSIEEVQGMDRLPVLVLRRLRPETPLTLRLDDASGAPATVLVDRVLYRAARADGAWGIQASYLLRQIADPILDVELPGAPSALGLRVALDGRQVDWQALVEAEQGGPVKHLARLRLAAALVRRPAVLDVSYQLKPGQTEAGTARETLRPPLLVGDLRQAPTRWEVTLAPGEVALAPEGGATTRRTLTLRGWLLAPQLTVTGDDLERWFAGPDVRARTAAGAVPDSGLLAGGRRPSGADLRAAVGLAAGLFAAAVAPERVPVHPGPPVLRRPAPRRRLLLASGRPADPGAGGRLGVAADGFLCHRLWVRTGPGGAAAGSGVPVGDAGALPSADRLPAQFPAGAGRVRRWCGPPAATARPTSRLPWTPRGPGAAVSSRRKGGVSV